MFRGLHQTQASEKLFTQKYDEIVLIKDIRLVALRDISCPWSGGPMRLHPQRQGDRAVRSLASRRARQTPQMQERLTEELADLLMKELGAKGVAVVIEGTHSCMTSECQQA